MYGRWRWACVVDRACSEGSCVVWPRTAWCLWLARTALYCTRFCNPSLACVRLVQHCSQSHYGRSIYNDFFRIVIIWHRISDYSYIVKYTLNKNTLKTIIKIPNYMSDFFEKVFGCVWVVLGVLYVCCGFESNLHLLSMARLYVYICI